MIVELRRRPAAVFLLAGYAALLVAADFIRPLRIPEILHILAAWHFSWSRMMSWIAQTPASAPLSYLAQLPVLLIWHDSRFAARLVSLIFAAGSCVVFWNLLCQLPLKRPAFALAVLMLLPAHFQSATEARAFEQAFFLTALQLWLFLRLIREPAPKPAALYGGALTLCIYTQPYSILPAFGQFLFLLRFVAGAHERKAVWMALPATVAPPLLFLPYYAWAQSQTSPNWLHSPSPGELSAFGYVIAALLAIGFAGGIARTFRRGSRNISKRVFLFSAAGGAVASIAGGEILWAAPALVLLFFAALEQIPARLSQMVPTALAAILILCCLPPDANYLLSRTENVQKQAAIIANQLKGNSCVVFVSQGFSKDLFVLFEPQLERQECLNFFHHRIVLAIHPYVSERSRQDAHSYFRGLGFHEIGDVQIGQGEVLTFQQNQLSNTPAIRY